MNNNTEKNPASPSEATPKGGRRFPRWAVIVVVCLLSLGMIGAGRHFYLGWKERRFIRGARFFMDGNHMNEMTAALKGVYEINPNNVDYYRISAQAKLKQGDELALPALRRVVELVPDNLDDQIALAEAAFRFDRFKEADKVLVGMEAKARGKAEFHDLAGRLAQTLGRKAEVESHFAEAVKLSPENKTYQLHLAVTRLISKDAAVREKARNEVKKLSSEPSLRAEALRALVVDAVKTMQTTRALSLVTELSETPDRPFSDRLVYLEVLHLLNSEDFYKRLEETEQEAAKKPEEILPLLTWMNGNSLAILARDWAEHLPAKLVESPSIRLEMARSFAAYGDWKKLRFFLVDEKWGNLEYMRCALLARCYRELDASPTNSKSTWSEALNAASSNGAALLGLARLAIGWSWDAEATEVLWMAVDKDKSDRSNSSAEALNLLRQFCYSRKDTAGLYRAYAKLIERNPSDLGVKNNFALFSMLLNKDKVRALEIARELYTKEPANPVFASTYAFALFCMGENPKALEVMKKLKPEELQDPSVAAYYSAILTKAGLKSEAESYAKIGRNAALLPEEDRILNLAPATPAPDAK